MTTKPQSELKAWQVFRDLCTPATSWHDEDGWKQRVQIIAEAIEAERLISYSLHPRQRKRR